MTSPTAQPQAESPTTSPGRNVLLLVLAAAAGAMDAISYLGLGHVFTANMTGNTALLGIALGEQHWLAALRSALVLVGFDLGVVLGALVVERRQSPAVWPPAVTAAIALEGVVLIALAAGWRQAGTVPGDWPLRGLIVLSAVAMGIQSAAARRLGVAGVATTYVTGTLTSAAAGLIDRLRGRNVPLRAAMAARGVDLQYAVWGVYGLGAIAGGAATLRWQTDAMVLPIAAVMLVTVIAAIKF